MPGHLFYGFHDIYPDEFEFTREQRADGENFGERCADVRYRIDDLQAITAPLQFSILELVAHPREMPACQDLAERLRTHPQAQAYRLSVECTETETGVPSVSVVDFDPSVSLDQARELVQTIVRGEVYGPWSFVIEELD